ncbi:AI-2E family transporter [Flavobacterium ardleyense]|uniref:AI-2E family transporter n=1 Tax=Flavobacterium ardleyense TaxID=2038737 RepID=A0ABW5Z3Z9_9FLAO
METKTTQHIALDFFVVIAIVFTAYMLQGILVPLLISIILSVLIFPVVYFLERKLRFNRIFSATFSVLFLCLSIFAIVSFIGIQFNEIISKSDTYISQIEKKIKPLIHQAEVSTGIKTDKIIESENMKMEKVVENNFSNITSFLMASGGFVGNMVVVPLYMFFFLLYRKFFISFIYTMLEKRCSKNDTKVILGKLYDVQQNYLVGLITVMFIVGVLNSAGLLLLGIDFPFFFGFLCALLLLIPYIGILIGSLLPALVAFATKDSYWYAIGVIAIFTFIQILEGNIITPKITGSKVSVNAFVSILSFVVFAMLWGTSGMILALPITASLKVIFDHSERFKAYGFLLGEPTDEFLKSRARRRLKIWRQIRKERKNRILQS